MLFSKRIRCFISKETAKKVYQRVIEPHLRKCASVWDGMGSKLCEKFQELQNRAARVITSSSYDVSSSSLLEALN